MTASVLLKYNNHSHREIEKLYSSQFVSAFPIEAKRE